MPDLSAYKVDLDTPQSNGRRGESPRIAFTKHNDLTDRLQGFVEKGGNGLVPPSDLPPFAHGQCQLVRVSADELRLMPYNGNGMIINNKQCRIPQAGVPLLRSAIPSGATVYVVALDAGNGNISLGLNGLGEGHSPHTDGVEIVGGNPGLTLVGMAYNDPTGGFLWDASNRGVASWFNRRQVGLVGNYDVTSASTTWVSIGGGFNTLMWSDTRVQVGLFGQSLRTELGSTEVFTGISADGAVVTGGNVGSILNDSTGGRAAVAKGTTFGVSADGPHNIVPMGYVSTALAVRHITELSAALMI